MMWLLAFLLLFASTLPMVFGLFGTPRTRADWQALAPTLFVSAFVCALVVGQAWAFGDWRCLVVRCAVTP